MDRKIILLLFVFALNSFSAIAEAASETVDELIEQHIKAAGGRSAHENILSIARSGRINFSHAKKSFSYETRIVYPNKLSEVLSNPNEIYIKRGTDGNTFWRWSGQSYEKIVDSIEIKNMLETAERANRDILWIKSEIANLENSKTPVWAGKELSCISGIKDKNTVFLCFDLHTGLLSMKGNEKEYRLFKNWTRVKTLSIPHLIEHFQDSKKVYDIQLTKVIVNEKIEGSIFLPF